MKAASAFLSPPLVNCRLDRGPVLSVSLSVDQPVTQGIARASPGRTDACTYAEDFFYISNVYLLLLFDLSVRVSAIRESTGQRGGGGQSSSYGTTLENEHGSLLTLSPL